MRNLMSFILLFIIFAALNATLFDETAYDIINTFKCVEMES